MEATKRVSLHFEYSERIELIETIDHILEPKRVGFKQYIELRPEDIQVLAKLKRGLNAFEPKPDNNGTISK